MERYFELGLIEGAMRVSFLAEKRYHVVQYLSSGHGITIWAILLSTKHCLLTFGTTLDMVCFQTDSFKRLSLNVVYY